MHFPCEKNVNVPINANDPGSASDLEIDAQN